jgi:phosphatidate phosphatase APP1
MVRGARQVRD